MNECANAARIILQYANDPFQQLTEKDVLELEMARRVFNTNVENKLAEKTFRGYFQSEKDLPSFQKIISSADLKYTLVVVFGKIGAM